VVDQLIIFLVIKAVSFGCLWIEERCGMTDDNPKPASNFFAAFSVTTQHTQQTLLGYRFQKRDLLLFSRAHLFLLIIISNISFPRETQPIKKRIKERFILQPCLPSYSLQVNIRKPHFRRFHFFVLYRVLKTIRERHGV
jgi:hypothetical protein